MVELREVAVSRIHPNPYRDGTGKATWESVEKTYGFDEGKLKELGQSLETNGMWASLHVRQRKDGEYELAFGHHRLEAAKRAGFTKMPVLLGGYSDDQMLRMMAAENSEEWGHDFALGVLNAVEAAKKRLSDEHSSDLSPAIVGRFLGWTAADKTAKGGMKASQKVETAWNALELIENGALKRNMLKGLGHTQARELVSLVRRKIEYEEQQYEVQQEFLRKRAAEAQKQGDKIKLKKLEAQMDDLASNADKSISHAGQQVAAAIKQHFDQGASIKDALSEVGREAGVEPKKPKGAVPKVVDLSVVDALTEKLDKLAIFDDPVWVKILALPEQTKARKPFGELINSMEALQQRLKERSKELGRKLSG